MPREPREICGRYRAERERCAATRAEFERLYGIGYQTLYQVETGRTSPSCWTLEALARAGGDVHFVLTGKRAARTPVQVFLNRVHLRVNADRKRRPQLFSPLTSLIQAMGQLAEDLLHQPWDVVAEKAQAVAAMAARVALDGEPSVATQRQINGADAGAGGRNVAES